MYGIISSPEHMDEIKRALVDEQIWFEVAGEFGTEAFLQQCQSVSGTAIHTLIIDMEAAEDIALVKGVRQYRLNRDSRIVMVAVGRVPGDQTINELLKYNVYDFVAPSYASLEGYEDDYDDDQEEEEQQQEVISPIRKPLSSYIREQLDAKSSYSAAARWDIGSEEMVIQQQLQNGGSSKDSPTKGTKGDTKQIKHVPIGIESIEQIEELEIQPQVVREQQTLVETIIGTLIIAVIGVEPGSGATHTAILITEFLARKGRKVALIEGNDSQDFYRIANAYDGLANVPNNEQMFTIDGVDYYKSNYRYDVPELLEMEYDYIVLDLGAYHETRYIEEFYRAHVQVVTGHGIEWRQQKIYDFSREHAHRDQSKWIYCVPHANKLITSDVEKGLGTGVVRMIPLHADPYKAQKDTDAVLEAVLKEYMGQKRKKGGTAIYLIAIILLSVIVVMLIIGLYLK
ncbi:hypothetical protein [Paenibacillus hubeiensis]|uniref:hypothetical protein n=1 Tax=Paenibacillus hubeiensis TaxID=3077330 RepID=UPI0031BA2436